MKINWKCIWIYIKDILMFLFFGITTIFILKEEKNEALKNKKDKENEIKNKSPDDIIASSSNQSDIHSDIAETKEEFRKRVRDRFNQKL